MLERAEIKKDTKSKFTPFAKNLVSMAIHCPEVIHFEDIALLESVKDLEKSAKELFQLIDFFLTTDIVAFKKGIDQKKKVFEQFKIDEEAAVLKKQYLILASIKEEDYHKDGLCVIGFKAIAKLLEIPEDDVEEFMIEAMNHGVFDGHINQIEDTIIIKSMHLKATDPAEWVKI